MRKSIIIIGIVLILALGAVLAGFLYQRWQDSPRYALQQMVLALKEKNLDKLFIHLDLKEIFRNAVEDSTAGNNHPDDRKVDEWTRLGRRLGRKFARQVFPQLYDNFEKQIHQAVAAHLKDLTNAQILGLGAAVTTAKIEVQGEEALVTIRDPKTRKLYRFNMRRSPDNGVWQIVSLNYNDFKPLLKKELLG